MFGLYIHIPFCASRCIYCDFYSTTLGSAVRHRYVSALCQEMELSAEEWIHDGQPSTIYLGGGTPSMLTADELDELFTNINKVYGGCEGEITMECNPDDMNPDYAHAIAGHVNRVSMGAQTFDDKRLSLLHRRHKAQSVAHAVDCLRKAGVRNISIDLMFGFPQETLGEWREDIQAAIRLNVEHVSAYSLMYEEGTRLYEMARQGTITPLSDDACRDMYELLLDELGATSYEHYEISNFARPGFRSRHNSSYWTGTHYLGIGAAAHSYDGRRRSWNVADVSAYIKAIEHGRRPQEGEDIDEIAHYNDTIVTALRTREGIELSSVAEKFRGYLLRQSRGFVERGLMARAGGRLAFRRAGLFISDGIMEELIYVGH